MWRGGYNERTNHLRVYRCLLTNRLHGKAAEPCLAKRGVSIHWTGLLDWITGLDYWTETFFKKWLSDCTCLEFRPSFIQATIAPDNLIGIYS